MKTITASRCLPLMDEVCSTHEPIVITKRRKPVAKLVPANDGEKDEFIGRLKEKFKIVGDIESPVEPPEAWEYD